MIKVRLAASLGKLAGSPELEVEAATVKELIAEVKKRFQGDTDFLAKLKMSNLIVNDTNVNYLKGLKTKLKPGDVITFFPPVGGG